jgi:hypothetical protein
MAHVRLHVLPIVFIIFFISSLAFAASTIDHSIYSALLNKHVSDGRVDYEGFKTDESLLDQYLNILSQTNVDSLNKQEQFAFYINVYNAFTIKLILSEYPDIDSIKDLGGFFSSPWKIKFIPLKDKTVTLDYIEHTILRPTFKDARVHFAVNCASRSCPPLLNEAYEPDRLDAQLNQQTQAFITNKNNYQINGKTIYISKIFKWFKTDFNNDPIGFIQTFADVPLKQALDTMGTDIRIGYLDYDWSLNN